MCLIRIINFIEIVSIKCCHTVRFSHWFSFTWYGSALSFLMFYRLFHIKFPTVYKYVFFFSLTRSTPEHRNILPNHLPLEETILDGTELEEPEKCTSPKDLDRRISKFCHECGNRYPVASAKFCVECGVRRLILWYLGT